MVAVDGAVEFAVMVADGFAVGAGRPVMGVGAVVDAGVVGVGVVGAGMAGVVGRMRSVWYHAAYDEIWIRHVRYRIERGDQGEIKIPGTELKVRDHCSLFLWIVSRSLWKEHLKNGWLVRLGFIERINELKKEVRKCIHVIG